LIALSEVAAEYDGMYISHMRDEGANMLEAIEELLTIAREAKIRAEIYHLKSSGRSNWPLIDEAVAMVERARADGLQITADVYTYWASGTGFRQHDVLGERIANRRRSIAERYPPGRNPRNNGRGKLDGATQRCDEG
jgi:N-acyl-D-aspartate/D-glutamate deacylase